MSEIKVDSLTGKTTAKTVTVTVGATATQSLEKGLPKTLLTYDHPASTTVDSLNTSTVTDVSAGHVKTEMTTSFSSATARQVFVCGWATNDGGSSDLGSDSRGLNAYQDFEQNATGSVQTIITKGSLSTNNGNAEDSDGHYVAIFGDLA